MFLPADDFLEQPFAPERQKSRTARLLPVMNKLVAHHEAHCPAYKKITDIAFPAFRGAEAMEDLPYLPVSLFKHRSLQSAGSIKLTVSSSGTTGQKKSAIGLDAETARLTSRSLAVLLRHIIGDRRLPLLVVDCERTLASGASVGARAAAILGLMPFGRAACFVLDSALALDEVKLQSFLDKYKDEQILIYGFTSLIWERFLPVCERMGLDLKNAHLLHSGGWKHLAQLHIDNAAFRHRLEVVTGIGAITNFYGMAEMPGLVFPEHAKGGFLVPACADVLIRDPVSLEPVENGGAGLVQIFNPLAHSFPGHSLLTEDMGFVETCDEGKILRLIGRAPKAELRGCSDVLMAG